MDVLSGGRQEILVDRDRSAMLPSFQCISRLLENGKMSLFNGGISERRYHI
ncbi:hypothetical protein [Alkalinema sp. FACHB-956]|uniref:hypothetical protein n=1 Tax=Alkalinema sp. FACHB-956 TaxID=2692768 RepID=UPI00168648D4|nr:hypothetical protein [Alkalinema sp. FACHB-956]MBD2328711.1 hypothetical protein [Alkalinema sp. FACHB-956]